MQSKSVFRSLALPVPTFDLLKRFQRDYLKTHGLHLTNSQALTAILTQHQHYQALLGAVNG